MNTEVIKKESLPEKFVEAHSHNLYLYCKSYMAGARANSAQAKNRSAVSGGGKKPWAQKGGGRARAGSKRSPLFVGGGVAFGPQNNRNYTQKVNKKQQLLALYNAITTLTEDEKVFVIDEIKIESGKTKDASLFVKSFEQKDILVVKEGYDEMTQRAFSNLPDAYLIEAEDINAYLVASYRSIVFEKAVFDSLTKEV